MNLRTFMMDLKPNWSRLDRETLMIGRTRYHATSTPREQEPTSKSSQTDITTKATPKESKLINGEIRKSLSQLPIRARRLDQNELERKSAHETFLSSLDKDRRIHRRVGSTYAKARSPVYFPNIDMRLVRPSSSDRGDPFTAIFRCDIRLTKPDIFNYLRQIYGIGITSIRTAIYRNRNRRRLKSKVRGGVTIDNKKGERTFKKVWIGLDKPFFFPSTPRRNFLSDNFNFNDLINTYDRFKFVQSQFAKTDPNQTLPAGLEDKGLRVNVFRQILDNKNSIHDQLRDHVKKSFTSFTPSDPADSNPSISSTNSKPKKSST